MDKGKLARWFVDVTDGWNKALHNAFEQNVHEEYRRTNPNAVGDVEGDIKRMREFYYRRMTNTATLLIAITSCAVALLALFISIASALPTHNAGTNVTAPTPSSTSSLSNLKDIVVAAAAIFTAWAAYKGIFKWRNEESGKADFELSRRVGKSVFRMRDVLSDARNGFVSAYEFPAGFDLATPRNEGSAYAHVFDARWQPVKDCALEIQSLRNEAEALWGPPIVQKLDRILSLANQVRTAMVAYVRDKQVSGAHFRNNKDFGKKIETTVFDLGGEFDENGETISPNYFTVQVESAVSDAATFLRTKLPS